MRVHGHPDENALAALEQGITIDGIRYGPIKAAFEQPPTGRNAWLAVSLTEGKNREVRTIMRHLGLTVNRLIRTAYGPFQLGSLDRGAVTCRGRAGGAGRPAWPASARARHKGWAKSKNKCADRTAEPKKDGGHADHRRR